MADQSPATDRQVEWYHPGEVVLVARVRRGAPRRDQLHAELRRRLGDHIPADPDSVRSFTFDAPGEPMSLVFLIQKLARPEATRAVKDVVEELHGQLSALGSDDLDVVAAMPHWHLKAHEDFGGPSPGSIPAPVYPDEVRQRPTRRSYRPVAANLELADQARNAAPIRVAVLDTRWDYASALARAERARDSANNQQLLETVQALGDPDAALGPEAAAEWRELGEHHDDAGVAPMGGEPAPYHMPDHGLFVAGLIRGTAPRARLTYAPVMNDMGVGDLSLLLMALQRLLADKREDEPQVINLSLGFMPHPARLPAAWYGLPRAQNPRYVRSTELFDPRRDQRWVAANRDRVDRTVDLLQVGLRELARYLALNNCLVVAAVGNDSLLAVEAGHVRLTPRLPARFESVLGVAATTADHRQAAPYSNLGDERELGDHVATFGGDITDALRPAGGVVGIYSGEFPDGKPNETGWAYWSGTSFATAIVSGIAANVWASLPGLHAREVLAEVHARASEAGTYLNELRAPSIQVEGRWST